MEDFNRNSLKSRTLEEFRPAKPAMPAPSEHYIEEEDEENTSFFDKFKLIVPIIVIAVVCFIAYAWYTDKFAISNSVVDLPVVKASTTPLREKPEDPGGMKIINRDKKVYDAISGKDNDNSTKTANILPAPEEPLAREEIAKKDSPELINKLPEQTVTNKTDVAKTAPIAEIDNTTKTTAITENVEHTASTNNNIDKSNVVAADKTDKAEKSSPPETKEKPAVTVSANEKVAETKKDKVKEVTAEDITEVTPVKKAAPKKNVNKNDSGYRLQLGSYRSSGDAEASWKVIKNKFPDILNGLNDYIEKADLAEKGIYYRLQISGLKSESDARKICQKLTIQKQGCFFVGK